jgi:serine/threonine protein kinase
MAFELATGDLLFDAHSSENYSRNEDHLAEMISILGPIPKNCRKGKYSHNYFTTSGQLLHFKRLPQIGLEQYLRDQYNWDPINAKKFANFLLPMLRYDCQKRATASQCLNHTWITNSSEET